MPTGCSVAKSKSIKATTESGGLGRRLFWFAAIWAMSVAALGLAAGALRLIMRGLYG